MNLKRRNFLKGGVAGIVAASGLVGDSDKAKAETTKPSSPYPKLKVAAVDSILPQTEIFFDYPDENSPAILLRLDQSADGGIGPNREIVAFSMRSC